MKSKIVRIKYTAYETAIAYYKEQKLAKKQQRSAHRLTMNNMQPKVVLFWR